MSDQPPPYYATDYGKSGFTQTPAPAASQPAGDQPYPAAAGAAYPPAGTVGYSSPPQAGAPPPGQTTIVYHQPATTMVMTTGVILGDQPVRMHCPHCGADIVTATHFENGGAVFLLAGILFLVGCWLCCCIPFCVDGCKDVVHSCPNCNMQIKRHNRI